MPFTYPDMLDEIATRLTSYCGFWNMLFCRTLYRNNQRITAVVALIDDIRARQITPSEILTSLIGIVGDDADATGDELRRVAVSVYYTIRTRLMAQDDNVLFNTLTQSTQTISVSDISQFMRAMFRVMPLIASSEEYDNMRYILYKRVFHSKGSFTLWTHLDQAEILIDCLDNHFDEYERTRILSHINPFELLMRFEHLMRYQHLMRFQHPRSFQNIAERLMALIMSLNTEQKLYVIGVDLKTFHERFVIPVGMTQYHFDKLADLIQSIERERRGQIFETGANGSSLLTEIIYHSPKNLIKVIPIIEDLPKGDIQSISTQLNNLDLLVPLMTNDHTAPFSIFLSFITKHFSFEKVQLFYRAGLESAIKQNKPHYFRLMLESLTRFSSEQKFRILSDEDNNGTSRLIHQVLTTSHQDIAEIQLFIQLLHSLEEQHKTQLLKLTDLNGNNAIAFTTTDEPNGVIEYFDDMMGLLKSITNDASAISIIEHINENGKSGLEMILTMKTGREAAHLSVLQSLFSRFKTNQILRCLGISKDVVPSSKDIAPYLIPPLLEWATHLHPAVRHNVIRFVEGRKCPSCCTITTAKDALVESLLAEPPIISLNNSSLFRSRLNPKKEEVICSYFKRLTGETNIHAIKSCFNKINVTISNISQARLSAVTDAVLADKLQGSYFASQSDAKNKIQISITNININELLTKYHSLISAAEPRATSSVALSPV